MSSEWPRMALGEVASVFTGFPFKGDQYQDGGTGIRVVRGDNVTEHSLRWAEKEKCWPAVTDDLHPYLLQVGDVVIGMDGSKVGRNFAAVTASDGQCLLAQRVARVRGKEKLNQTFLRYVVCNSQFTDYVQSVHTGTSIPHISKSQIERYEIYLPPLSQQIAVGSLLKSLDDRIALLRETNATLEAIAQALFKSWFVDFDPVHAKQQGRAPEGMDEVTAALFPDSFEESELGLVPKGWRWAALEEACTVNPPRKLKKGEVAPYIDMASVPTNGHCPDAPVLRELGSGSKFQNGDTLLARITPCLENGKTAFVDCLDEGQTGWGSTEFIVLKPKPPLPDFYAYLLCRLPSFREFAIQSMSGTSGRQRVQNDVLGRFMLAMPDASVEQAFGNLVQPIQQKIASNHRQAQTLATLRDTLLPRLISGQLRLPEAEAVHEAGLQ